MTKGKDKGKGIEVTCLDEKQRSELKALATLLVDNHVSNSAVHPDLDAALKRGGASNDMVVVALVGAGATAQATFDSSAQIASLKRLPQVDLPSFERILDRVCKVNNFEPTDLEANLESIELAAGDSIVIKKHLSRLYDQRHPTLLSLQIVAHLMKHRFVDVIVNLNFDELLDQAIDDEIRSEDYRRIVTERDAVNAIFKKRPRAEFLPLYVKLHGTASDPETLRYTRDSYWTNAQWLDERLRELFAAQDVVVLNVGTSMTSFELNYLLAESSRLRVYTFGRSKKIKAKAAPELKGTKTRFVSFVFKDKKANPRWRCEPQPVFDERDAILLGLSDEIGRRVEASKVAKVIHWRSVNRHVTITALCKNLADAYIEAHKRSIFGPPPSGGRSSAVNGPRLDLVKFRTKLELVFLMAKSRGLLSLETLVKDRAGHYVRALEREDNGLRFSLLLKEAGFKKISAELYTSRYHSYREDDEGFGTPKIRSLANDLFTEPFMDDHLRSQLVQCIESLQRDTDVEATSGDELIRRGFQHPVFLPTMTAVRAATANLFAKPEEIEKVRVIAETGQWLLEWMRAQSKSTRTLLKDRVKLLVAFNNSTESLEKLGVEVLQLPWWRHNRHMTLVRRNALPDERVALGIYFNRRLRTPHASFAYLWDRDDVEALGGYFDRYWTEAKENEAGVPPGC